MRTMSQQRLGSLAPGWAAQENGKERLWEPKELGGGSICCSLCSVSNSVSHTTLSIKWEGYFSKELCPLVFIVLTIFPCIVAYVLCGYATSVSFVNYCSLTIMILKRQRLFQLKLLLFVLMFACFVNNLFQH